MSLYMLPSPAGSYTPTGLYNLSLHPNHSLTGKRYTAPFPIIKHFIFKSRADLQSTKEARDYHHHTIRKSQSVNNHIRK